MTNKTKSTSKFNKEAFYKVMKDLIKKCGGLDGFSRKIGNKAKEFGYDYDSLPSDAEYKEYTHRRTPRTDFILLVEFAFPNDVQLDSFLS